MPRMHLNLSQCKGIILTVDSGKDSIPVYEYLCPYSGPISWFLCSGKSISSNEEADEEHTWFTLVTKT